MDHKLVKWLYVHVYTDYISDLELGQPSDNVYYADKYRESVLFLEPLSSNYLDRNKTKRHILRYLCAGDPHYLRP